MEFVASQKKSALNGLVHISISRMVESVELHCCLETRLSSFVDSAMFMDPVIRVIITQKRFITPVKQIVKNTLRDQFQVAAVQDRFQEAIRAAHDVQKLEPTEILSPSVSSCDEK